MGSLFFIRHAAVEIRPGIPAEQWRLSAAGREQSRALAERLSTYQITLFVCSEEEKARECGRLMAETLGVRWRTAPGLHEHDRSGMPYFSDFAQFKNAIANFFTQPDALVLGNETAVQARTRLATAVDNLLQEHHGERLAIVTHGTVLAAHLAAHNPALDAFSFWSSLPLPSALIVDLPSYCLRRRIE